MGFKILIKCKIQIVERTKDIDVCVWSSCSNYLKQQRDPSIKWSHCPYCGNKMGIHSIKIKGPAFDPQSDLICDLGLFHCIDLNYVDLDHDFYGSNVNDGTFGFWTNEGIYGQSGEMIEVNLQEEVRKFKTFHTKAIDTLEGIYGKENVSVGYFIV